MNRDRNYNSERRSLYVNYDIILRSQVLHMCETHTFMVLTDNLIPKTHRFDINKVLFNESSDERC